MSILLKNIYAAHWLKFPPIKEVENFIKKSNHILLNIKDTIAYNTLLTQNYELYHKFITETNQHEHSIDIFETLQKQFDLKLMPKIDIEYDSIVNKYVIRDGVHRLSILVWKKIISDSVPLDMLNIIYDKNCIEKIKTELQSTRGISHYNNWCNTNKLIAGYHTFKLGNVILQGQRDPVSRLNILRGKLQFKDKNVVDFGCNTGGMLLHLPEICKGIGFDYDARCIKTAKYINDVLCYNNSVKFHQFDFDKNELATLPELINFKPDYIFILSMGSWVKKWKELYSLALSLTDTIILETNNDVEGRTQLEFFSSRDCNIDIISEASTDDITNNNKRKLYVVKHRSYMKVFIAGTYHHKNQESLYSSIKLLNWVIVNDINDAEVIFSPAQYIDASNFPNKKFIFGPHFSVFPNENIKKINNIHNNCIYIQPSQQSIDTWQKEFGFQTMPMCVYAFGVNVDKFNQLKSIKDRNDILLYYKSRKPDELDYVLNFLRTKGIEPKVFNYKQRYNEIDYIKTLQRAKYGIWLGAHESQGFALEEALSCNVPLLVWNVTLRVQQYGYENVYKDIKSRVTTIPYWDDRCGEYFYNKDEISDTFDKFIINLENYKPREYILENLSIEKRSLALYKLVNSINIK